MIELKLVSEEMSKQQINFELNLVSKFKVSMGCFAVNTEANKYCNEHIQWLWEQARK